MKKKGEVWYSFNYAGHIRQMLKDIKYEQDEEAIESVTSMRILSY